jgi:hypothetical protein
VSRYREFDLDGNGDIADATVGFSDLPDLTRDSKGSWGTFTLRKKTKDWGRYAPFFL